MIDIVPECPRIFFVTSLVLQLFEVCTIEPHSCDDYPIGSSLRVPSAGALLARPSSGYALDLLPLGFVTKATCTSDYSVFTLTYRVVWWIVEADVDVLEGWASCVQLAVLLTTHRDSHRWLSLIMIEETPSHATTIGSWIGVDLEIKLPSTGSRSTIGWRRVLWWWKRLGRSYNMEMMTQMLVSIMTWLSRVLRSFLGMNFVERVAIKFLCSDVEKHPKD